MASTILLKHGPGAPTSGELEYRELGYDHTNHKLYIGNSSGGVTLLNPTYSLSSFGVTATAAELNRLDGITATTAELNYTDGVTSNIQTQLNGKQATITGAASTIASSNLTSNRALISNSSGKVNISGITATELGYLDGVTSSIQTQLNGKAASSHTHNYAGSSSAGGAANSANKLNTDAGSSTQPVYFKNGVPVAATPYSSATTFALRVDDTRDTNPAPSGYPKKEVGWDFKNMSKIQINDAYEHFGGIETINPYSDSTGGPMFQIAYYAHQTFQRPRVKVRSSQIDASSWGSWEEFFTTYICHPNTIVTKRNNAYVQEFSASTLSGGYHSDFGMATTVLACNGDRSACTDAITATTKVSSSTYRLIFDAASSTNMRINLLVFRF